MQKNRDQPLPNFIFVGRCCTTLTKDDSHREFMGLGRLHDEVLTRPLPREAMSQLQRGPVQARLVVGLAGRGHDL